MTVPERKVDVFRNLAPFFGFTIGNHGTCDGDQQDMLSNEVRVDGRYYLLSVTGSNWGHAICTYQDGGYTRLFDPNSGEYKLDLDDFRVFLGAIFINLWGKPAEYIVAAQAVPQDVRQWQDHDHEPGTLSQGLRIVPSRRGDRAGSVAPPSASSVGRSSADLRPFGVTQLTEAKGL